MKANELMIGDWVVYRGDAEYTNPVRIDGMDIRTCSLITEDREDVGFDGIEPIPITPEILEKNGFEFDSCGDCGDGWYIYYDEGCHYIGRGKNGKGWNCILWRESYCDYACCVEIKSVHQLQHAMRLCGIEKEIEL